MATASSSAIGKLSKEEWRRKQDLEAARKAGTAPAEVDEEGKSINPHIPQFMAQAPWYMDTGRPSLKHQKAPGYNDDPVKMEGRFKRGVQTSKPAAKKYRKGACENCGAMTHTSKDCVERPRKRGAKWTNDKIAPDEMIHDFNTGLNGLPGQGDWDAKRDRWDGYDAGKEFSKNVEEFGRLEEERRRRREEEIDRGAVEGKDLKSVERVAKAGKTKKKKKKKAKKDGEEDGGGNDSDSFGSASGDSDFEGEGVGGGERGEGDDNENDDDDLRYAEGADVAGQRMDAKTRVTVRNLRIREDTAVYLHNLDPESAYYDPKTRSMRDAPDKNVKPEDAAFAGENFTRGSGDVNNVKNLQLFAWQSEARGNDVHVHANPTQAHILHQEFLENKEKLKDTTKTSILDKYGGEEHLKNVPRELLSGQNEDYVEYSRTGQVIKGREKAKPRSKYDEDVYINNHTSIWGSYYNASSGQWGYACCHSNVKHSYCAGKAAIEAAAREASGNIFTGTKNTNGNAEASGSNKTLVELRQEQTEKERREKPKGKRKVSELDDSSDDDNGKKKNEGGALNKKRLAKALREEDERKKMGGGRNGKLDERDMDFEGLKGSNRDVTEEEMEAYHMKRVHDFEDPMASYKDTEMD